MFFFRQRFVLSPDDGVIKDGCLIPPYRGLIASFLLDLLPVSQGPPSFSFTDALFPVFAFFPRTHSRFFQCPFLSTRLSAQGKTCFLRVLFSPCFIFSASSRLLSRPFGFCVSKSALLRGEAFGGDLSPTRSLVCVFTVTCIP